jgi:hypothetical protein
VGGGASPAPPPGLKALTPRELEVLTWWGGAWPTPKSPTRSLQDDTYPLAGVQDEITQMQDAGFPVTLIHVPGDHYDDDNDDNDTGTDNDLRHYLLPHINDGWQSPA